ncbi:sigma-70 family RNA polymerase sigma factor [Rhodoblastus acidophilus]|uniref:RNA polymerase sigma factor n=1 Tax=Rhodoblastus acidophilus TaxID=1074 RepID=A0A6N8DQS5_RHOAC|nr:sigma-70 family RNA polymerase sigma factor [Rhodoblastus acidophilus]MCW2276151.1 RNA polymerase sigma-70 factor (ECF subfamily) [Rhodoblastus acidophilus]MTV32819.1 sigma-70 family RNA polymerase sigma factor [Rhodoblastus acidophilus]
MPPFSTSPPAQVKLDLIAHIPRLRAFALSFCGSADQADDLVQETLVKAWSHRDSFIEGTNLSAWLFTILRNAYFSQFRKRKREVPDVDGIYSSTLAVAAGQTSHMEMLDLRVALAHLPANQREALLLIGAAGHSYAEVADICGCAIGTIKSRVNRARKALIETLRLDPMPELIEAPEVDGRENPPRDRAMLIGPIFAQKRGGTCEESGRQRSTPEFK